MKDERAALEPEDLVKLQFLGEVQLSPDGSTVYYDVYQINRDKNIYQGAIWQQAVAGGEAIKLTAGVARDSNPRLSPDGTKLAFLSDRDKLKQAYWLNLKQAGEAIALTTFQSSVTALVWCPDNRHVVVTVETPDDSDKATQWHRPESAEARKAKEEREQMEKRIGGSTVTFNLVKQRADGRRTLLVADAHTQLWLVDTQNGGADPRQLTSDGFNAAQPTFAPDGQSLVFSATRDLQQRDFSSISDLWLIKPFESGGEPQKLTQSKGPAAGAVWSPDGKQVAYIGHTNPKDGSFLETSRVWVLSVGGEIRALTADFDFPVANLLGGDARAGGETVLAWSADSRTLYFSACVHGTMSLFEVSLEGDEPRPVFKHEAQIFASSFAGQMVALGIANPLNPGDIFVMSLDKSDNLQQVTFLNQDFVEQHYIAEPETIRVPSRDGKTVIEGWLVKPLNFDPTKQYPLVMHIHGGPHTAYGHSFFFEFQLLAGQGAVVLYTNPRGSVSYGYDFAAAIRNDWGHHDYEDLMDCMDYAIAEGYVDSTRLGVTGGSYGGYMTNWIISQTDRFKVALADRSVTNMVTMYTLSDISFGFVESEFEGNIWSNPRIWERSPIAHAQKVNTALLMMHSEADFRCPIEQSEEFYFALKRLGREVSLVRTPGEDHNLSRSGSPDHRISRLKTIRDWFGTRL